MCFQEEAKVALVLGAKMARMQAQIERRAAKKKKSPLYDIVCHEENVVRFIYKKKKRNLHFRLEFVPMMINH